MSDLPPEVRKLVAAFVDRVVEEAMAVLVASTTAEEDEVITPEMLEMARIGATFGSAVMCQTLKERGCIDVGKFSASLLGDRE